MLAMQCLLPPAQLGAGARLHGASMCWVAVCNKSQRVGAYRATLLPVSAVCKQAAQEHCFQYAVQVAWTANVCSCCGVIHLAESVHSQILQSFTACCPLPYSSTGTVKELQSSLAELQQALAEVEPSEEGQQREPDEGDEEVQASPRPPPPAAELAPDTAAAAAHSESDAAVREIGQQQVDEADTGEDIGLKVRCSLMLHSGHAPVATCNEDVAAAAVLAPLSCSNSQCCWS